MVSALPVCSPDGEKGHQFMDTTWKQKAAPDSSCTQTDLEMRNPLRFPLVRVPGDFTGFTL